MSVGNEDATSRRGGGVYGRDDGASEEVEVEDSGNGAERTSMTESGLKRARRSLLDIVECLRDWSWMCEQWCEKVVRWG